MNSQTTLSSSDMKHKIKNKLNNSSSAANIISNSNLKAYKNSNVLSSRVDKLNISHLAPSANTAKLREYPISSNISSVNNNVDYVQKNLFTVTELSHGCKTLREEKVKEQDKENLIKLVNRKRIRQYFTEEYQDIIHEIHQDRQVNSSETELNFGIKN